MITVFFQVHLATIVDWIIKVAIIIFALNHAFIAISNIEVYKI